MVLVFTASRTVAQTTNQSTIEQPKLVVGIVIDQMRWDYIYRYYNVYKADGGFKRFLNEGFTCKILLSLIHPL